MMQTDVKSASNTTSSTFVNSRARLKGVYVLANAAAGTLTFNDGGSTGTALLTLKTPATPTNNPFYMALPGEGILFQTSIYANLTSVDAVTVFYG